MKTYDRYEKAILSELQDDARLTNQELADRIGLSASPCWRRVKALEESGVIRRYTAILDPQMLGVGECVFAHVTLERHVEGVIERFESMIRHRPEVLECFATTGDSDYLLRIVVPSTQAYGQFLEQHVFTIPGVGQVRSNVSLRAIKYDTRLPLDHAPTERT